MLFDSFYTVNFQASVEKFLGCTGIFIGPDATSSPEIQGTFVGVLEEDKEADSILSQLTKGLFKVRKEVLTEALIDPALYNKIEVNGITYTIIDIKDSETGVLEFQLGVSETKKYEPKGNRRVF